MRALVIGASGQVGAALGERLTARGDQWVGTYARVPRPGLLLLDITDADATRRLVDRAAPDWVFCAGALTHVDYCEEHPEEALRLNRDAPGLVARAAAERGAGIVFYSSEYVFDGEGGPYGEDDPVRPISVYGRSKLEGERAVGEANPRAAIVRTTVVYGPEPQGKNFVYQLIRRGRAGERMRAPDDQISSPTYNADLAAASLELAERGLAGLYHIAGPEVMDRHAFARLACRVFGLDEALLEPVHDGGVRPAGGAPPAGWPAHRPGARGARDVAARPGGGVAGDAEGDRRGGERLTEGRLPVDGSPGPVDTVCCDPVQFDACVCRGDRSSIGQSTGLWLQGLWVRSPSVTPTTPGAEGVAPVAQLDRALASEAKGQRFDSSRAHHRPRIASRAVSSVGRAADS